MVTRRQPWASLMLAIVMLCALGLAHNKVQAQGLQDGSIATYNGVAVQGQCAQFVENYASQVLNESILALGINHPTDPGAHWIWDDPKSQPGGINGSQRIANTGSNFPQKDDIIVWSSSLSGSGGAGHVGIVYSASSATSIRVIDANWNGDGKGLLHTLSGLGNVLGWFRASGKQVAATNPTGSITSPSQDGAVVRGPIAITGTAMDTVSPVSSIRLSLDGVLLATVSPPTATWSVPFNPAGRRRGPHTLTLTVTDQAGLSASFNRMFRLPAVIGDYDGDGKVDFAVWRPSTGSWFLQLSGGGNPSLGFGNPGDIPVPGDYDGDGKTDFAVYRPSNGWWGIVLSSGGSKSFYLGNPGDIPVPADYDGDGITDFAVYRPSTGSWFFQMSGGGSPSLGFGNPGDIPVPGDYDGDGKADPAVWRPSTGTWFVQGSRSGGFNFTLGNPGDIPVPADYDGDGITDFAVYRPSTGSWFFQMSRGGSPSLGFGNPGDIPVPGDYNGDGKTDFAVWRPSNGWWGIVLSSGGSSAFYLGNTGDIPVSCYLPH